MINVEHATASICELHARNATWRDLLLGTDCPPLSDFTPEIENHDNGYKRLSPTLEVVTFKKNEAIVTEPEARIAVTRRTTGLQPPPFALSQTDEKDVVLGLPETAHANGSAAAWAHDHLCLAAGVRYRLSTFGLHASSSTLQNRNRQVPAGSKHCSPRQTGCEVQALRRD
jgi:hypothetical protein